MKIKIISIFISSFIILMFIYKYNRNNVSFTKKSSQWKYSLNKKKNITIPTLKNIIHPQKEKNSFKKNNIEQINIHWEKALSEKLLRHKAYGSKVYIKPLYSETPIKNKKDHILKKIIVINEDKNGIKSFYNAIVNTSTGDILETYNKTIHESYRRASRIKLHPKPLNTGK